MSTCSQKIVKVGSKWETEPITAKTANFLMQVKMKAAGNLELSISGAGELFDVDTSFDCNPDPTATVNCSDFIAGSKIKFASDVEIESLEITWDSYLLPL